MAQSNGAYPAWRDENTLLLELIGSSQLSEGWLLDGQCHHRFLHGLFHPILDVGLGAADLLQG